LLHTPLFFNRPAPPELYPLSLHDALPIWEDYLTTKLPPNLPKIATGLAEMLSLKFCVTRRPWEGNNVSYIAHPGHELNHPFETQDRKSTRLNSSHVKISYAVFCLNKKVDR